MFKDNVIIIAGASRGIGAELALQLASLGARLCIAARNSQQLEQLAVRCSASGAEVLVCPTDLTEPEQCRYLIEQTIARFGRIDTLIYNAGKGVPGWFADNKGQEAARYEMELNYWGMIACLEHALPHLIAAQGRIVGIATMGALVGLPYFSGYNAAKHAMSGFLNTLRVELQVHKVSVTVIYPGAVATEQLHGTLGKHIHNVPTLSPEQCARQIILSAWQRKRSRLTNFSGRVLYFFYRFFPTLIDKKLFTMTHIYSAQ
jgi:short-subunit dehydrogenase